MTDLHTKYRPKTLSEVKGQDDIVKSLMTVIKNQTSRAFFFEGPAGTGKTTLARCVAEALGIGAQNVEEYDAATNSSVEDIRKILEGTTFAGLGQSRNRLIILDEVHMLSKSAFNALLKRLEEPPKYIHWALCTTEAGKVPETIRQRCVRYALKPLSKNILFELVTDIARKEGFNLKDDILSLVADRAGGSGREALTGLSSVSHCETREQAAAILRAVIEETDIGHLLAALYKGQLKNNWPRAAALVKPIMNEPAESIRIRILTAFSNSLLECDEKNALNYIKIIDAFITPYPPQSGIAPLLISLANVVYKQ